MIGGIRGVGIGVGVGARNSTGLTLATPDFALTTAVENAATTATIANRAVHNQTRLSLITHILS